MCGGCFRILVGAEHHDALHGDTEAVKGCRNDVAGVVKAGGTAQLVQLNGVHLHPFQVDRLHQQGPGVLGHDAKEADAARDAVVVQAGPRGNLGEHLLLRCV